MEKILLFSCFLLLVEAQIDFTEFPASTFTPPPTKPSTMSSTKVPIIPTRTFKPNVTTAIPVISTTTFMPTDSLYYFNDSGNICILLKVGINFLVNLTQPEPFTKQAVVHKVDKINGFCGELNEEIVLNFFKTWKLTFHFVKINESYSTSKIIVAYNLQDFPDSLPITGTGEVTFNNVSDYGNINGQAFGCTSGLFANKLLDSKNSSLNVYLTNIELEAFRYNNNTIEFNDYGVKNCSPSEINNLIPIIVGSVLGALIILVLVVYLITRRKRKSGYESV